ncbi:hypothetical protein L083_3600 [Actinoplanes sp. N902-109]|nr:hypothetical protein L083_3600 [Actinoplanes sp. N902-109]
MTRCGVRCSCGARPRAGGARRSCAGGERPRAGRTRCARGRSGRSEQGEGQQCRQHRRDDRPFSH